MNLSLTEQERSALQNCLGVAASKFRENAEEARKAHPFWSPKWVADQFESQAKEADALYLKLGELA